MTYINNDFTVDILDPSYQEYLLQPRLIENYYGIESSSMPKVDEVFHLIPDKIRDIDITNEIKISLLSSGFYRNEEKNVAIQFDNTIGKLKIGYGGQSHNEMQVVKSADCTFWNLTAEERAAKKLFRLDIERFVFSDFFLHHDRLPIHRGDYVINYNQIPDELFQLLPDKVCGTPVTKQDKAMLLCLFQTISWTKNETIQLDPSGGRLYLTSTGPGQAVDRMLLEKDCEFAPHYIQKKMEFQQTERKNNVPKQFDLGI